MVDGDAVHADHEPGRIAHRHVQAPLQPLGVERGTRLRAGAQRAMRKLRLGGFLGEPGLHMNQVQGTGVQPGGLGDGP